MSKVVVSEFVTLDGVMEDPGGGEGFQHGGDILVNGSARLAQSLTEHDLTYEPARDGT